MRYRPPSQKIGIVGITEYAQKALGDVVYVELPATGSSVEKQGAWGCLTLWEILAKDRCYRPDRRSGVRQGRLRYFRACDWQDRQDQRVARRSA